MNFFPFDPVFTFNGIVILLSSMRKWALIRIVIPCRPILWNLRWIITCWNYKYQCIWNNMNSSSIVLNKQVLKVLRLGISDKPPKHPQNIYDGGWYFYKIFDLFLVDSRRIRWDKHAYIYSYIYIGYSSGRAIFLASGLSMWEFRAEKVTF